MKVIKFNSKYLLRIDKDEEIIETLKKFCLENNILLGTVSAIGSVNNASIGFFNTETKKYYSTELKGDHEVTSLSGNISQLNGDVYLHIHITLSDSSYKTYGGHLNSAIVSGTLEMFIDTIEQNNVERKFNEDIGLNLIN